MHRHAPGHRFRDLVAHPPAPCRGRLTFNRRANADPARRDFSPGRRGFAETYRVEFELKLPLASGEQPGRIADAAGNIVAGINTREFSAEEAERLARLICRGVNWFALPERGSP